MGRPDYDLVIVDPGAAGVSAALSYAAAAGAHEALTAFESIIP